MMSRDRINLSLSQDAVVLLLKALGKLPIYTPLYRREIALIKSLTTSLESLQEAKGWKPK